MKPLIVGLDFTEITERLLDFASSFSSKLHLVHVVEPIADAGPEDSEFHRQLEERALTRLSKVAQPLGATFEALTGSRCDTLIRLAEERDAILVLGCPRLGPDRLPRIGTSQRVLWRTQRPVMLVP